MQDGAQEESVLSFAEAVVLAPNEPAFWIHRIKAYIAGHDYQKALAELNLILDTYVTNPFMFKGPNNESIKLLKRVKNPTTVAMNEKILKRMHKKKDQSKKSKNGKSKTDTNKKSDAGNKSQSADGSNSVDKDGSTNDNGSGSGSGEGSGGEGKQNAHVVVDESKTDASGSGHSNADEHAKAAGSDSAANGGNGNGNGDGGDDGEDEMEEESTDVINLQEVVEAAGVEMTDELAALMRKYVAGDNDLDDYDSSEGNGFKQENEEKLSEDQAIEAILIRAKLNLYLCNLEQSQQDVTWASLLDPVNPDVGVIQEQLTEKGLNLVTKAQASFMVGDYAQAMKEIQSALELNPNNVKIFMMRAKIYRKMSKYDAALTDLKTALALCLQTKSSHQQMAQHQKNIILAGGLKAAGLSSALNEDYDNPYGSSPPDTPKRKRNLEEMHAKASKVWDAWALDDDTMKSEIQKQLASTFNDLALQYIGKQKLSNAVTCLNKAIELDSTVAAFFLNRGDCHRNMNELGHAMADYHLGAKLDPKHSEVRLRFSIIHNEIGRQLYNKCKYEEAESEFSKSLSYNGTSSAVWASRGTARYRQHKWAPSYSDFVEAVKLNPSDSKSREQALLLRSIIFKQSDLAFIAPLPPPPEVTGPFNAKQRAIANALKATHANANTNADANRASKSVPHIKR
jgi:tetratricopeptide (TPR) repeat protein